MNNAKVKIGNKLAFSSKYCDPSNNVTVKI